MLPLTPESLASGFLASIRQALPDTAIVREALSFIRLVIDHPSPPREIAALHKTLWDVIRLDPSDPLRAAERVRRAGHQALRLTNHASSGQVLELALLALSLRFDDRPRHRMLCVDLGMMAAGLEVVGIEDVVPEWKRDGAPTSFMSEGVLRPWIESHVVAVCRQCQAEVDKQFRFSAWTSSDFECALLAVRMIYGTFRLGLKGNLPTHALIDDFDRGGERLWIIMERWLQNATDSTPTAPDLMSSTWHRMARRSVRGRLLDDQAVPASKHATEPPPQPESNRVAEPVPTPPPKESALSSVPSTDPDGPPMLTVCRNGIVEATDRCDKDEVARHKGLEKPLPLARMPHADDVQWMREQLGKEFPWAQGVLETIFGDLLGRARLGVQVLAMPPTLLVGPAGSGKSRLARRIAEELKVPRIDLALGGTSDTKVLGGTSRGWGNGRPGDLATLMATRKSASAIVLLDEIDKTFDGLREGGGIQAYLLALLEPETARRHTDVFLKTECDFSAAMWIATANRLSTLQGPLVTRFRVLMLEQPGREHFPVIAENVLVETASSWGMEREIFPRLDELELPWDRLASARQVRLATEGAVVEWARGLRRH